MKVRHKARRKGPKKRNLPEQKAKGADRVSVVVYDGTIPQGWRIEAAAERHDSRRVALRRHEVGPFQTPSLILPKRGVVTMKGGLSPPDKYTGNKKALGLAAAVLSVRVSAFS